MKLREWDLNLKIRLIGETIHNTFFWMFFPFVTLYFIDQFGAGLAGLLMTIPPVVGVLANLAGGYAADRYGRKRVMIASLALDSLFLLIFAISPSPWLDYLVFIGLSAFGNMYHPASMAMVADLMQPEERKSVFAVFYSAHNLGVVIGPTLGALFFFDHRSTLLLFASLTSLIIFLIMLKAVHETLPSSAREAAKASSVIGQLKNYTVIFTDKVFFLYIVAGISIGLVFMQLDLYLGAYVRQYVPDQTMSLGLWQISATGEKLFGWLLSENGLLVVLFTVLITRLAAKWNDEKALILSSVLYSVSFWLNGFTANVWAIMALMAVFTLAELIRTPAAQNFVTDIAPEDQRGQYLGASSLQFSISRTLAPLAITFSAYFSPVTIFSGILAAGLLSAFLYKWMFVLYRRQRQLGRDNVIAGCTEEAR